MNKRRLGWLVAILLAAALAAGASLAIYRVFLAPTQAVEIELDRASMLKSWRNTSPAVPR